MEVVKNWKPEMKRLGFVWTRGAFEFLGTRSKAVQLMISIQKNLHADTYKINPSIMFTNPLVGGSEPELFLLANLRRDGIYLHVTSTSWWTVADLGLALAALTKYILPWFQEWGQPGKLVEVLEAAIREEKTVIDAAESLPEESTRAPWHGIAAKIRITPLHFYQAAVLHYLNGDIAKAISRTRDWIARLDTNESLDLGKAHTQLSILQQIGNKSLQ